MPPPGNSRSHRGSPATPGFSAVLCNGHGEDLITLRIIQAVHGAHRDGPDRALVGAGRV